MALFPGSRLGPYEITAQVGAGGMGEGYRARTHRLAVTSPSKCCLTRSRTTRSGWRGSRARHARSLRNP